MHHGPAERWFAAHSGRFATCPSTPGSLLRVLVRGGRDGTSEVMAPERLLDHDRHEFWPDDLPYRHHSPLRTGAFVEGGDRSPSPVLEAGSEVPSYDDRADEPGCHSNDLHPGVPAVSSIPGLIDESANGLLDGSPGNRRSPSGTG